MTVAMIAAAAQPHRPGALHRADRLAAIGAAHHFPHQHRACRPLASEAETLEAAHDQQLLEILGEAGQKGEEREPRDHDAQEARPADAIGEHAGDPSAESRDHQRARRQQPGLSLRDVPDRDQRGDGECVKLNIRRIERPAAEARPERPAFIGSESAIPIEHGLLWLECVRGQSGHARLEERRGQEAKRRTGWATTLNRSRATPRPMRPRIPT